MDRVNVLGVEFDNVTMSEALSRLTAIVETGEPAYVVTPNPEMVYACYKDPSLYPFLADAGLCVPDGIGVIHAARILGTPLKERVPGIELGEKLIAWAAENGKSVFLLGAKPGVAETAGDRLREKYPGLVVAGTHDGYFQDDAPVLAQINAAAPDLLLVCLGAPKQEIWMHRNAPALNAGLMIGGGGSLDVYAGTVERAPEAWCRAGLEWLYRLLREPRRIKRMMSIPRFMGRVFLASLRRGR
jgi:N-acetylglucosaminyldiphosphoundecaprenol N-acetyl-beta-D-mannosaminyltransferase